jgi:hypothetical protein
MIRMSNERGASLQTSQKQGRIIREYCEQLNANKVENPVKQTKPYKDKLPKMTQKK